MRIICKNIHVHERARARACVRVCVCDQMCVYTMWAWGGGREGYMQLIIGMIIRTVHVWMGVYN